MECCIQAVISSLVSVYTKLPPYMDALPGEFGGIQFTLPMSQSSQLRQQVESIKLSI